MSRTKSEVLQLFDVLDKHVVMLFAKWNLYVGIFGDKSTLDGMNAISGVGFGLIQQAFLNDVVASICAASDQPSTGKFENLTVVRLLDEALPFAGADDGALIERARSDLDASAKSVRVYRHKVVGHFDLATLTASEPIRLCMKEIHQAMDALAHSMSIVSVVLRDRREVAYKETIPANAVGELSWLIIDGQRSRTLRQLVHDKAVDPDTLFKLVGDRGGRMDNVHLNRK